MTNHTIQLLSAFMGSVGFALLFNVRGTRVLFAASSGFVSWALYMYFAIVCEFSDFPSYVLAAAGLTLFSEVMARIRKAPATIFLVVGMIPLLPGGSLYRTLHYAVASNWSAFTNLGIYTLSLAIAIALGIISMMSFVQIYFVLEQAIKRKIS